ncbi:MAG: NYN domain-containing protein [Candidatus Omnitrophica bacterium]|nr:NYN domain-containing protein [Candidatus Omnitrophota bacterium]
MSSYLIVDGYNLIHKWPKLVDAKNKSIEFARDELFHAIQRFCDFEGCKGTIVYDGSSPERSIEESSPTVIYSSKKESADTIIESLAYKLTSGSNPVKVVTDDRMITNMVIGMGAFVTSTTNFLSEIERERFSRF